MISSSARTAEVLVASSLDEHLAVRHRVFVELQGLFVSTDVDEWDACAQTLHAVQQIRQGRTRSELIEVFQQVVESIGHDFVR